MDQSETRQRTLMVIYMTDTMVSMLMDVPPLLRVSELKVPLPESDELWYAESHQKWQQTRRKGKQGCTIRFNEVPADLMNAGDLIRECNGVVGLHVIMVGIQEMIAMARRMKEVDGEGHVCSTALMAKAREALETWKGSWQASQSERATTKGQYLAIMSSWCGAELSLAAPDLLLTMVHRVSTTMDQGLLVMEFLKEVEHKCKRLDLDLLMTPTAAAISHVEVLSEFGSVEECPLVMETTAYPSVTTSIFEGGLTLWFAVRVLERVGRYVPRAEKEILPRLPRAVESIRWASQLQNTSIACATWRSSDENESLEYMIFWETFTNAEFSFESGKFLCSLPL
jgi:hypothetical protein